MEKRKSRPQTLLKVIVKTIVVSNVTVGSSSLSPGAYKRLKIKWLPYRNTRGGGSNPPLPNSWGVSLMVER